MGSNRELLVAHTQRGDSMGKMNEITLLANEAGILQYSDIEDLKTVCIKLILGNHVVLPRGDTALMCLAEALQLNVLTRGELAAAVCVTKEQAMALRGGGILHHVEDRNRDGTPLRVRVSGKCQIWKTRPAEFRLPVKYGFYESGAITHTNRHHWYVAP